MERAARYESGLEATKLRLGLPGTDNVPERTSTCVNKRAALDAITSKDFLDGVGDHQVAPLLAKAQVVGWPPVRCYRSNNSFQGRKTEADACGIYVKVSMDGAPFLRKIDLNMYKAYKELREAAHHLFKCFPLGKGDCISSDCAITYEDEDGDWMLVGDVPWEMFISSCKKLRIMKGDEARAPESNK